MFSDEKGYMCAKGVTTILSDTLGISRDKIRTPIAANLASKFEQYPELFEPVVKDWSTDYSKLKDLPEGYFFVAANLKKNQETGKFEVNPKDRIQ